MTPFTFGNRYSVVGAAWLIALASYGSSAQGATASVSGTVRTADGAGLKDALVIVGRRSAPTDSLGRYHLDSLDAGLGRIVVRRIGFSQAASALTLRAGERIEWNVMLREDDLFKNFERLQAQANQNDAASGHVDSVARRLVRPNSDLALPLGAFGSRLFAAIVAQRGTDSNTVLSPVSVGFALSLARFGARGATADALDQVLGMLPLDQQTIERRGAAMMSYLQGRTDVTLELANAIWVDTAAVPTSAFRASTSRWRAKMATLPLATSQAVQAINHWADSVTHGKIAAILDKPFPDTTRLFIANAVYFKGKWLDPFDTSATRPGEFKLPSGKRIMVPRMSRVAIIGYRRDSGYQSIRLPYRTGKVAMYIVLPDSGVTFDAVARRLATGHWAPSTALIDGTPVHVVLPRFHSEVTLDLGDPLMALGLRIAFDCDSADFSAMARATNPSWPLPLCIGKAVQKTYIDVDEEGTEAAAVTGLMMVTVTSAPPPPVEFIVDRPFLFVLRDEMTGTDLFVGRIARP
jgi:serine protease inhibitor